MVLNAWENSYIFEVGEENTNCRNTDIVFVYIEPILKTSTCDRIFFYFAERNRFYIKCFVYSSKMASNALR